MSRIDVALGERSYPVLIEHGLLDRAAKHLGRYARAGRLVVVSDETVWAAQGARLIAGLSPLQATPVLLPPGEESKSWSGLSGLVDRLLVLGVERSEPVIAFGGGVIGDLAGFAAAILRRGCPVVQIPTTLLAQVDSAVGGKTGINTAAGKNMVGAFHQPSLVLIDPHCLDTLPARQLRAGYAEIVKYALIEDADLFGWLERHGQGLIAGGGEARREAIHAAIAGKAAIVAEDERETDGRRMLLNLGHTFGHALEAETGFSERLLHGEAVAIGLVLAFGLSVERGICPPDHARRVEAHLSAVGLPTSLAEAGVTASGERLTERMASDKKKAGGQVPFILARGIGKAFVDRTLALSEIAAFLDARARPG